MRQYFYLVCAQCDGSTFPKKIFLQKHQAIQWGRRKATIAKDSIMEYALYKQEITRTAEISFMQILEPYKEEGTK